MLNSLLTQPKAYEVGNLAPTFAHILLKTFAEQNIEVLHTRKLEKWDTGMKVRFNDSQLTIVIRDNMSVNDVVKIIKKNCK